MKRLLAGLCAAALLISLTQSAEPFGMGREGRGFGRLGAQNKKSAGGGGGSCSNWKLDFSDACNSMYIL